MTYIHQKTLNLIQSAEDQAKEALKRYQNRFNERKNFSDRLKIENPFEIDSSVRAAVRKALLDSHDGLALKRIIGKSDLFPISYLEAGLKAAKPVCRIEVHDNEGKTIGYGTGFLVSGSLLLTNNHVLENEQVARDSLAQFNYETNRNFIPRTIKSFRLIPEKFFITNRELDFTLVAIESQDADGATLDEFGFLRLTQESGKALIGEYVSIIQHPQGAPKSVAIRENRITDVFDGYIHYITDTQSGSSGSPVFNDEWIVVALHHAGVPDPSGSGNFIANEGIRISSIMSFLKIKQTGLSIEKQIILKELLADSSITAPPESETSVMITEVQSEEWYKTISGYDPDFLGNYHNVPLPQLKQELQNDIALLKDGSNILHYTHFSILVSKSRRLAYFTAVNIDGKLLIELKREKDRWYFDPRLDRQYQMGPEFYVKNDLDRGHLVRRSDPVWGELAQKANEDTFHFTNCSPQHKNFNQKTWLSLEDYILRNADNYDLKITVFTGPVFRPDDLIYRGTQIPAEFWKVVVFLKSDYSLSATAYLQTQKNLIEDMEFAYGPYRTYQTQISKIEQLTGLHFGKLSGLDPLSKLEGQFAIVINQPESIRY